MKRIIWIIQYFIFCVSLSQASSLSLCEKKLLETYSDIGDKQLIHYRTLNLENTYLKSNLGLKEIEVFQTPQEDTFVFFNFESENNKMKRVHNFINKVAHQKSLKSLSIEDQKDVLILRYDSFSIFAKDFLSELELSFESLNGKISTTFVDLIKDRFTSSTDKDQIHSDLEQFRIKNIDQSDNLLLFLIQTQFSTKFYSEISMILQTTALNFWDRENGTGLKDFFYLLLGFDSYDKWMFFQNKIQETITELFLDESKFLKDIKWKQFLGKNPRIGNLLAKKKMTDLFEVLTLKEYELLALLDHDVLLYKELYNYVREIKNTDSLFSIDSFLESANKDLPKVLNSSEEVNLDVDQKPTRRRRSRDELTTTQEISLKTLDRNIGFDIDEQIMPDYNYTFGGISFTFPDTFFSPLGPFRGGIPSFRDIITLTLFPRIDLEKRHIKLQTTLGQLRYQKLKNILYRFKYKIPGDKNYSNLTSHNLFFDINTIIEPDYIYVISEDFGSFSLKKTIISNLNKIGVITFGDLLNLQINDIEKRFGSRNFTNFMNFLGIDENATLNNNGYFQAKHLIKRNNGQKFRPTKSKGEGKRSKITNSNKIRTSQSTSSKPTSPSQTVSKENNWDKILKESFENSELKANKSLPTSELVFENNGQVNLEPLTQLYSSAKLSENSNQEQSTTLRKFHKISANSKKTPSRNKGNVQKKKKQKDEQESELRKYKFNVSLPLKAFTTYVYQGKSFQLTVNDLNQLINQKINSFYKVLDVDANTFDSMNFSDKKIKKILKEMSKNSELVKKSSQHFYQGNDGK